MSTIASPAHAGAADRATAECRLRIGVWGDRSCPELEAHIHCRNCPVYAQSGRQLLARERDERRAVEPDSNASATTNARAEQAFLVFRVQQDWLALRAANAREVVEHQAVHRVPHRNDPRFLGLANVHGEILPAADLARLLELPTGGRPGEGGRSRMRLLVIERERQAWVLPVAEVEGVQRIDAGRLQPPPVTLELGRSAFTEAVFDGLAGPVGILDEETLWYALQRICR